MSLPPPVRLVLTPLHIRLAMAALEMNNRDLAPHIEVASSTISSVLRGEPTVRAETIYRIAAYFESKGIAFIYDDDAPGIRVSRPAAAKAAE